MASIEAALARARERLGRHYPIVIGGTARETSASIASYNPARPSELVASVGSASLEQAVEAIEVAATAFERWKRAPVERRARLLVDAAAIVRRRRDDFNALLVLEVGKTWIEADADTAEAIDFLEFYAREALRYAAPPSLVPVAGEENRLTYIPLGVGVVIPPWNFAFAIMAGMTAAAVVVAGNTAVLKPSSDSPTIAAAFIDVLREAGLEPGVVNFVPGSGRTIGDALVAHPKTRFIAFTGSKEVGLHINELAAKTQAGQIWIKRVIAEMGGKDGIVVAADADLDAAADGIVASAFGFAGQKCSACSRAIVEDAAYDELAAKIVERTRALAAGDPADRGTYVCPVINESAMRSILDYIDSATAEGGTVLVGGARASGDGWFVEPTVIGGGVAARYDRARGDLRGRCSPSSVRKTTTTRSRSRTTPSLGSPGPFIRATTRSWNGRATSFTSGNLYFNRKCTGALVGAHPFGGFNMSGTDSKAGGADYLGLFMQAKMVSKKIPTGGLKGDPSLG